MSRMHRIETPGRLSPPGPEPSPAAALAGQILAGLSDDLKTLRGEMDTRFGEVLAHVNDGLGQADSLITGLHQDVANLILRWQALGRVLGEDPTFGPRMEAAMAQVAAEWAAPPKGEPNDETGRAGDVPPDPH